MVALAVHFTCPGFGRGFSFGLVLMGGMILYRPGVWFPPFIGLWKPLLYRPVPAGAFFLCRPPIRNLGTRLVSECGKFFAVRPVSAVYCRGGIT